MVSGDWSPETLISQARSGNGEALGQLLEIYRNYLRMLADLQIGRHLQAKVDASDVVQETCMEVHRSFAGFRGATESEFLGWLRSILASRLHTLIRSYAAMRRDLRVEVSFEAELDRSSLSARSLAASQSSPSGEVMRCERAVILANAICRLPARYREVLMLHHFEGLGFEEVAWRMKRTVDSVKNLRVRALSALHDILGELSDGLV